MRRAIPWMFGLAATSCFEGGDATGLPCDNDAQCGASIACIDRVCGGATATSATGDTGEVPVCAPPVIPMCGDQVKTNRASFEAIEVRSTAMNPISRPSCVVTGFFDGDEVPDLAVTDFGSGRLHLLVNEGLGLWSETFQAQEVFGVDSPYDVVASDLDCAGGTDFLVVGQTQDFAVLPFDNGFQPSQTLLIPAASFSLGVADLVEDPSGYPDVVISQGGATPGVVLLTNVDGKLQPGSLQTGAFVDEPWDTTIVPTDDGPLVLVPEGRNYANDEATDAVRVFVVSENDGVPTLVEPPSYKFPAEDFASPWAVAYGDFLGPDSAIEVVIAERHVTSANDVDMPPDGEEANSYGSLRIFAYRGPSGSGGAWEELANISVGFGPTSLSVADLDCDRYDDVIIGLNGATAAPGENSEPQVLYGGQMLADMQLENMVTPAGSLAAGSRHAVADFDMDGFPEVAIADFGFAEAGARIVIFGLE